jgi:hypothetical protein
MRRIAIAALVVALSAADAVERAIARRTAGVERALSF